MAKEKEIASGTIKKKHRGLWWKILLIVLAVIILVPLLFVGIVSAMNKGRGDRAKKDTITNTTGLVQAEGTSLYDKDGKRLILRGVNAGGMLVTEGWMVPYSCGENKDENGNILYNHDKIPTYPTLTEEKAREGFLSNPNLTDEQRKTIIDTYRANWFSEEDFKTVKNELGMNMIRLPFYYLDILKEDKETKTFTRKSEEDAFSYFDWFLEQCKENEIYLILDLHGAPGGNNGYEHSGQMNKDDLWRDETYINATVDLWNYIATHYTETKPELGQWIASYDLINEPCADLDDQDGGTKKVCFDVFDKIYQGIRSIGDNHVITMEGVWDFTNFANPKDYGWTNIQYEFHQYNWQSSKIPEWLFEDYYELKIWGHYYDVPYYCGEFTCFDDEGVWKERMALYDKRAYSYSLWNYKIISLGWWTTTRGVKNVVLNLQEGKTKTNLKTATYDELLSMAESVNSKNCQNSNTYTYWRNYFSIH